MKKVMIAVLTVCMAVAATGCSIISYFNSTEKEIGTLAQQSEQETSSEANKVGTLAQQSTQNTTAETKAATSIKPGYYIKNSKFKMSFVKAKQYNEISGGEYLTNTPKIGKKYLVLFFEVENVSEEKQFVNSFYFNAYEDGYDISPSFLIDDIEGYSTLSGDLAAGKKTKGYIVYEVDPNWKEFEVTYQQLGDKETYDFALTPQDLS